MADWNALAEELDRWAASGAVATLWWRDDDATRASPDLDHLLALRARYGIPVALAVIPRDLDESLPATLAGRPDVAVLQHGWSHDNHASVGAKTEEHGPHRPRDVVLAEIARGWARIAALPGSLPVYVAPWNRLDPTLLADLPRTGLRAVSAINPRRRAEPVPGIREVNIHCDLIDWPGSRGFLGDEAVLGQIVSHLAARRSGNADPDEPTGMMSHHLFHDPECWDFLDRFLGFTRAHPAVRWLSAGAAFWPEGRRAAGTAGPAVVSSGTGVR